MTPSPEKIVELRNKVAMNQAALAGAAKVSVRTVQRAEAGEPIELQTAQQIATALGVQASAILLAETVEGPEPGDAASSAPDGNMSVALRPATTARALLDAATRCDECRLDHEVDVSGDALQAAIQFCEALEPTLPVLCPEQTDFSGVSDNPARRMIARLQLEARLNDALLSLKELGIGAYAGTYMDLIKRPRYDMDEGVWYTKTNQPLEAVTLGIIRLGPLGRSQLTARVKVEMPF